MSNWPNGNCFSITARGNELSPHFFASREDFRAALWGGQSCPQPAFLPAIGAKLRLGELCSPIRLKAGCSQDWLPIVDPNQLFLFLGWEKRRCHLSKVEELPFDPDL